jgi:hypothetical protein
MALEYFLSDACDELHSTVIVRVTLGSHRPGSGGWMGRGVKLIRSSQDLTLKKRDSIQFKVRACGVGE